MKRFKQYVTGIMAAVLLAGAPLSETPLLAAEINASGGVDRAAFREAVVSKNIISFRELREADNSVRIGNKIALSRVLEKMPKTLSVTLADGSSEKIEVDWECVGDYEHSNYFYYQFQPVWDENVYTVAENASIPYVNLFLGADSRLKMASQEENREEIFNFMKEKMGFNTAAACGVLANIQSESSFRPTASMVDTNGLTSYGLCQWNGPRFESLKSYCAENGYDYQTVEGQLYYLKYELEHSEASACAKVKM